MGDNIFKDYTIIGVTLLLGMILTILPLPGWAAWARPNWVLLILIFWLSTAPALVGIKIAWLAGLYLDVLTGTLLGQHAFTFSIVAYLILKFEHRFQRFPFYQQVGVIALVVGFDLFLNNLFFLFIKQSPDYWMYWSPILTSALIWPWLSLIMKDLRPELY